MGAPGEACSITTASAGARHRFSRSFTCTLWAWEITRHTSGRSPAGRGNSRRATLGQGHLLGLAHPQPADEPEDAVVGAAVLRELVAVAPRVVPQQVAVPQRPLHVGAREAVQHRRQLPEVPQKQEAHAAIQRHAGHVGPEPGVDLSDLLDHQPVQLAAAVAHRAAHPVVRGLRAQAQVLRGAVRLGHQLHHVPGLLQLFHDAPREVRLAGAEQPGEQQAAAPEAVGHGVFHRGGRIFLVRLEPVLSLS